MYNVLCDRLAHHSLQLRHMTFFANLSDCCRRELVYLRRRFASSKNEAFWIRNVRIFSLTGDYDYTLPWHPKTSPAITRMVCSTNVDNDDVVGPFQTAYVIEQVIHNFGVIRPVASLTSFPRAYRKPRVVLHGKSTHCHAPFRLDMWQSSRSHFQPNVEIVRRRDVSSKHSEAAMMFQMMFGVGEHGHVADMNGIHCARCEKHAPCSCRRPRHLQQRGPKERARPCLECVILQTDMRRRQRAAPQSFVHHHFYEAI